jgi:hypothetical protein
MSLFPDEDVLTREIEAWRGFIDKLSSEDDKAIMTRLLNDCYEYAVAINSHNHPFPAEPVIMALLLSQHKMINHLKSIIQSKQIMNSKMNECISIPHNNFE